MTEKEIMEEIKRLTLDYLWHCRLVLFQDKCSKNLIIHEIYYQADTPQRVIDELYKKHGFWPYENTLKHQVLVINRTPWWFWLIQVLFIMITLPLSVPLLMLWSWVKRDTLNFMRTDGSIYLEKIRDLCKQAGVDKPSKPAQPPIEVRAENNNSSPTTDLSNQGKNMPSNREVQNPMQALTLVHANTQLTDNEPQTATVEFKPPESNEEIKGMANMAEAFTQGLVDRPTILVECEVKNTKGSPVFMRVPQIEKLSPVILRQRFDYAAAWTKPWQELDEFSSETKLLRQFTFVRRQPITDKKPANIIPSTGRLGNLYAGCLSIFCYDSKSLLKQVKQYYGDGHARERYHKALDVAKNNQEYTDIMEELINFHHEGIALVESRTDKYRPEDLAALREEKRTQLNEYLDQLPEDYHLYSTTAQRLTVCFNTVWGYLEKNEIAEAWNVFGKDEVFEKSEIKILIETPFVQKCLPHLVSMWHQLMGLFFLNGGCGLFVVIPEQAASSAKSHMEDALKVLQENNLPDAAFFNKECFEPLKRMQTHVEELFKQTPRETATQNAIQHLRDIAVWNIEERCSSYRHEMRGTHLSCHFFLGQSRNMIRRIDAMQSQARAAQPNSLM